MFYVLDENKNLIEAYSKEDVLALLETAIADGDLSHVEEDSAFVSKFKSLLNGTTHHLEFVTQAKYNELQQAGTLAANTYYFITDDTTAEDLDAKMDEIIEAFDALAERIQTLENTKHYQHCIDIMIAELNSMPPVEVAHIKFNIFNKSNISITNYAELMTALVARNLMTATGEYVSDSKYYPIMSCGKYTTDLRIQYLKTNDTADVKSFNSTDYTYSIADIVIEI